MGFFGKSSKKLKNTSIDEKAVEAMLQREVVAEHLAKSWVDNLMSADAADKRMKELGYERMDLGGRKFDGELQVNPFFKRGQQSRPQRPTKCPGCGAPTERKLKCNYCGSEFPW